MVLILRSVSFLLYTVSFLFSFLLYTVSFLLYTAFFVYSLIPILHSLIPILIVHSLILIPIQIQLESIIKGLLHQKKRKFLFPLREELDKSARLKVKEVSHTHFIKYVVHIIIIRLLNNTFK